MLPTICTLFHFLLIRLVQTALVDLEGFLFLLLVPSKLTFILCITKWFSLTICRTPRIMTKFIIKNMNRILITLNALIIITFTSNFVLGSARSHDRGVSILHHHTFIKIKCDIHLILWFELLFLSVLESFLSAFRTNVSLDNFHPRRSATLQAPLLFLMFVTFLVNFFLLSFVFAHSLHNVRTVKHLQQFLWFLIYIISKILIEAINSAFRILF